MDAILALDAGTTNVKAILVNSHGNVLARASAALAIQFPRSGWVEQSAAEIWRAVEQVLEECIGGKDFVTDLSNASRTQPLSLREGDWDSELLALFGVPVSALPRVMGSNEHFGIAPGRHAQTPEV
jgi:glycerol kinase